MISTQIELIEEKIFRVALSLSFLCHAVLIVSFFIANIHYDKKITKTMEVVYQAIVEEKVKEEPRFKEIKGVMPQPDQLKPQMASSGNEKIPAPLIQQMGRQPVKLGVGKNRPAQMPSLISKRHIAVPLVHAEKITNPKYLNYHDRIRDKIKNRAYFYVDDPRFEAGEVYLTFVLSADGELQNVQIIDSKTSANDYLRNVGMRSIKESNPFPAFPADLKYPELSFNVVISFEINE